MNKINKMNIEIKGNWETKDVWINDKWLDPKPSQEVYNHSPDGFNWGYGGSGPSQLALAISLEFYDKEKALKIYQELKWRCIATLPQSDFEVSINKELLDKFNKLDEV